MSTIDQSQSIWNRIVAPDVPDMPPEAARFLLSLRFPPADMKRYKKLASKEQCDLEISEREELESLVQANTALMLLQAKAQPVTTPAASHGVRQHEPQDRIHGALSRGRHMRILPASRVTFAPAAPTRSHHRTSAWRPERRRESGAARARNATCIRGQTSLALTRKQGR